MSCPPWSPDYPCSLLYDLNSRWKGSLCLHPLIYFNQMVRSNKNRPNPQALDDPSQLSAEDQLFDPSGPPPMAPTALEETVWQNHHLPEGRALTYWLFPSKSCRIVQIVLILLWNNLWTRIYIAGAIRFCCSKYQKRSYSTVVDFFRYYLQNSCMEKSKNWNYMD